MPASIARQYWSLTKPRVVALIVFTAVIGMFLAVPGLPPLREALFGTLGIWLAASSAAAINQLLDSRIDAQMARTSWRPLVAGTLTPRQALLFALVLAALSMTVLVLWVNPLTALLTFFALIGYAVIYTVLLVLVTVLPWATGMSGLFYLGGALVLGIVFLWYAWHLMDPPDELYAMRVFNYSIVYLMALFAFLLIDHWLMPWLQPAAAFVLQPAT